MSVITKYRVAMIDDEESYLDIMKHSLRSDFEVTTFVDPLEALRAFKTFIPDAVILDIHLKEADGFEVFRNLRELRPDLPVFFLSNNSSIEVIEKGLITGGTDYLTKNTPYPEIVSRIKARLESLKHRKILICREIKMDTGSRDVFISGKKISLSPKEYDILKIFMERPDQILTKNDLLDLLWKGVSVDANNIDTHMFHIRRKFGKCEAIECRKGVGYILHTKRV